MANLDVGRNKWFEIAKEMVTDEVGPIGAAIVNQELVESCLVDMPEDATPESFPYRVLDGTTMESYLIAWQTRVSFDFARGEFPVLGRRVGYLQGNDIEAFGQALVQCVAPSPRWVESLTAWLNGVPIADEDVAQVVAHFLMADGTLSHVVRVARNALLPNALAFFKAMCCGFCAAAFGDGTMAQEIFSGLKAHD